MTELANLISWQLDRALAFEKDLSGSAAVGEEGENLFLPVVDGDEEDTDDDAGKGTDGDNTRWPPWSSPDESSPPAAAAAAATLSSAEKPSKPPLRRVLPPSSCRAVASAAAAGVRIGDAGVKGFGAFAAVLFEEGTTVGDYEGEWLSLRDLDVRYPHTAAPLKTGDPPRPQPTLIDDKWMDDRMKRGVGLTGDYIFGAGADIFVDGEDMDLSNWGRFVNHAPEDAPGCNLRCKTLEQDMHGNPRVWFVATREIAEGEELLFDYGDNYWDDDASDAQEKELVNPFAPPVWS